MLMGNEQIYVNIERKLGWHLAYKRYSTSDDLLFTQCEGREGSYIALYYYYTTSTLSLISHPHPSTKEEDKKTGGRRTGFPDHSLFLPHVHSCITSETKNWIQDPVLLLMYKWLSIRYSFVNRRSWNMAHGTLFYILHD